MAKCPQCGSALRVLSDGGGTCSPLYETCPTCGGKPYVGGPQEDAVAKVAALVKERYEGSYRAAFDHYDEDNDGKMSNRELVDLLYDAEIGIRFTRWAIALKVVQTLDTDGDGLVSWEEFQTHLTPG
jgi:hypothetical protein